MSEGNVGASGILVAEGGAAEHVIPAFRTLLVAAWQVVETDRLPHTTRANVHEPAGPLLVPATHPLRALRQVKETAMRNRERRGVRMLEEPRHEHRPVVHRVAVGPIGDLLARSIRRIGHDHVELECVSDLHRVPRIDADPVLLVVGRDAHRPTSTAPRSPRHAAISPQSTTRPGRSVRRIRATSCAVRCAEASTSGSTRMLRARAWVVASRMWRWGVVAAVTAPTLAPPAA